MQKPTRRRWLLISNPSCLKKESREKSKDKSSLLRRTSRTLRSLNCIKTLKCWSKRTCNYSLQSLMLCRSRSICLNSSNKPSNNSDRHRLNSWNKRGETLAQFQVLQLSQNNHFIWDMMTRASSLFLNQLKSLLLLKDRDMKIILHSQLVKFKMLPLLHKITAATGNLESLKKKRSSTILTINLREE